MTYFLEELTKNLSEEEKSDTHQALLLKLRQLVDESRRKCSERKADWDAAYDMSESKISESAEDKRAADRGEPARFVVPIGKTQLEVFVSLAFKLLNENGVLFELVGFTNEDQRSAAVGTALLARDLNENKWPVLLGQFLRDIGRYGIGVLKLSWAEEYKYTSQPAQTASHTFNPQEGEILPGEGADQIQVEEGLQKTIAYKGNRLVNVSPYKFIPDTRFPLTRFQEGEFVASEEVYGISTMGKLQVDGLLQGFEFVRPVDADRLEAQRMSSEDSYAGSAFDGLDGKTPGMYVLTEMQWVLIPAKTKINGQALGPEKYPCKYLVWYLNDDRIVRFEKLGYPHDKFTYVVAQFTPDQMNAFNEGLVSVLGPLQDAMTWLMNSRIASVRQNIDNRLVVNPQAVEWSDLIERRNVIRMKPGATDVNRVIKQLEVNDVTASHLGDIGYLEGMSQKLSGLTENAMGQLSSGRRPATEISAVNDAGSARINFVISLIWSQALSDLGKMMLENLRTGLDEETFVRLVGQTQAAASPEFIKVSKADLAGNYDFESYDASSPTQRVYAANAIGEILQALIANPEVAAAYGLDPVALLMEQLALRGIRNPQRFVLNATRQSLGPNGAPTQNPGVQTPTAGAGIPQGPQGA